MRKQNIFGKKINSSNPFYYLIIVFVISILCFASVSYILNLKLAKLKEEQNNIQTVINNLLLMNQETNYLNVEELSVYLPNSYNEAIIYNELLLVKNMSNLAHADLYQVLINQSDSSPFEDDLNENLKFVKISIDLTIDDYHKIFDYINNLNSMDRLYYLESLDVTLLSENSASISMVIYTYYMSE